MTLNTSAYPVPVFVQSIVQLKVSNILVSFQATSLRTENWAEAIRLSVSIITAEWLLPPIRCQ